MKKTTVLLSLLLCSAMSAAGQTFLPGRRPGSFSSRQKKIDLRIREERREKVINCIYLTALVSGVVLGRMYPEQPKIHMGIPAGIALSTMTYAFYIENRKPKFRK